MSSCRHLRILLLTLCPVLLAEPQSSPVPAQVGVPLFQAFGRPEGIPAGRISLIAQDASGHVWAGGQLGVLRGDGQTFRPVHLPTSDQEPVAFLAGGDGAFWVATTSGLVRVRHGRMQVFQPPGPGRIQTAVPGRDGTPLVLAGELLFRVVGDHLERVWDLPGSGAVRWVSAPPRGGQEVVLVGDILWARTGPGFAWVPLPALPDVQGALRIAHDGDGVLWACAGSMLARLDGRTWTRFRPYGLAASFRLTPPDARGHLWALGPEGPLALRADRPPERVALPAAIGPASVKGCFQDSAGMLWLAAGLVYRQQGRSWRAIMAPEGKGLQDLWAIHEDPQGRLWVGTSRGIAEVRGEEMHLSHPLGRIRAMLTLPWGEALVLAEEGLKGFRSGQLRPLATPARGLQAVGLWDGRVVAVGPSGVWRERRPGSFDWEAMPVPALEAGEVLRHWMGSLPGGPILQSSQRCWRWVAGAWLPIGDRFLGYTWAEWEGELWGARWKDHRIHRFKLSGQGYERVGQLDLPGLTASDAVYTLRVDARGRLWTLTSSGVFCTRFRQGKLEHQRWTTEDGLPSDDCNQESFLIRGNGQVLVGSYGALAVHDPAWGTTLDPLPAPCVSACRFGDSEVLVDGTSMELPPLPGPVELSLAALLPPAQGRLVFEYRSTPGRGNWMPLPSRTLALPRLGPGATRLEFRVVGPQGIGPAGTFELWVKPAWWQTLWAHLGLGIALAALVAALIRLQARWALRRAESLRKLVELRTHDLAEVNEALKLAKAQADEASLAKSAFLANMSHELRTPLNAILLYSDLLVEEVGSGQPQLSEDVGKIRTAGKHLLGLIDTILDLSKIEAGRLTPQHDDVDIPRFLSEVEAALRPVVERKGNQFQVQCQPLPGHLETDPTMLRQILTNLVGNAAKFTEHGTVTLSVDHDALQVHFRVADTGIGLSEEQIKRIFEPFVQAEEHTARRFGGTGLGLTISRKLAELLGGQLTVTSSVGHGTTFQLSLPLLCAEQSPGGGLEAMAPFSGRVLVIDDDEAMRFTLKRTLERDGHQVVVAGDGEQGLSLARDTLPHLITLDVFMPGKDGYQVLHELKREPSTASIPVVLLSMTQDRQRGYAMGAQEVLSKPVDYDQLRVLIQRYQNVQSERVKVLVVEDDEATRRALQRSIQRAGWHCLAAPEAYTGLALVAGHHPDLIVLDLMMPQMDGFEFLAELAGHPEMRNIPVVILTAMALTEEDRRRLQMPQVREVLLKGACSRDQILQRIRVYARQHSAERPPEA